MGFAVPPAMSRLRGLLSAGALIGAVAVLCLAGAAAAEEPMVFDVLRDGSKIGEHRVLFEREDGTLKVSVETDMSVTFAFLTVFSYEHRRIERWRDSELGSLAGMNNARGTEAESDDGRRRGYGVRARGKSRGGQ